MILKINYKELNKLKDYRFLIVGVCCFECDKFQDIEIQVCKVKYLKYYINYRHDDFLEFYHVFIIEDNNDLLEVTGLYDKE